MMRAVGVAAKSFYVTRKAVVEMFAPREMLDRIFPVESAELARQCPDDVMAVAASSSVGHALVELELLDVRRIKYQQKIKMALDSLMHTDYEESSVEAFKIAMHLAAEGLVKKGVSRFERVQSQVTMFDLDMDMELEDVDSDWVLRYGSALLMAGLNTGQLKFMPWEAPVCKAGNVPKAPQFLRVPEKALVPIITVRGAMSKMLNDKAALTLEDMRAVILTDKNKKVLKELDKNVVLDFEYLSRHAEKVMKRRVEEELVASVPSNVTKEGLQEVGI